MRSGPSAMSMRPRISFRSAPAQNTFWSERMCSTLQDASSWSSLLSKVRTHSSLIAFTGG